jgi:hypothetical protein
MARRGRVFVRKPAGVRVQQVRVISVDPPTALRSCVKFAFRGVVVAAGWLFSPRRWSPPGGKLLAV